MCITERMVHIEFYLLGEDHTWDTDFIAIPESLLFKYRESAIPNPTPIVEWVYTNANFKDNICMIGIYNDESVDMEEDDAEV